VVVTPAPAPVVVAPAPTVIVTPAPAPVVVTPAPAPVVVTPAPVDNGTQARDPNHLPEPWGSSSSRADTPKGKVHRANQLALGFRAGSHFGGHDEQGVYGDFGMGGMLRYRPDPMFGMELSVMHHNASWSPQTRRAQTIGQVSGTVMFLPNRKVQPYVLGGMSLGGRHKDVDAAEGSATVLFGPHGGAGVEIFMGERFALDLDARATGWVNLAGDPNTSPLTVQTSAAVVAYF